MTTTLARKRLPHQIETGPKESLTRIWVVCLRERREIEQLPRVPFIICAGPNKLRHTWHITVPTPEVDEVCAFDEKQGGRMVVAPCRAKFSPAGGALDKGDTLSLDWTVEV